MYVANWLEQEKARKMTREARRLFRRARRRMVRTLFFTFCIVGFALFREARMVVQAEARVIFSVSERDVDIGAIPRARSDLRDYISTEIFSGQRVAELVERMKLYPNAFALDPQLAFDEFWSDMDLQVFQNQFIVERQPGDPPRSARLAISFRSYDPDEAVAVVRALADLILDYEEQTRRETARIAVDAARGVVQAEQAGLLRAQQHLADLQARAQTGSRGERAGARGQLRLAEQAVRSATDRARQAAADFRRVRLGQELEREASGLRLTIIEPPTLGAQMSPKRTRLILTGVLVFVLVFPLVAFIVGAFDPRVYDRDDAARLGLRVLGHVPTFPGDRSASLRARLDAGRRAR